MPDVNGCAVIENDLNGPERLPGYADHYPKHRRRREATAPT
jgi:hypothetical protein